MGEGKLAPFELPPRSSGSTAHAEDCTRQTCAFQHLEESVGAGGVAPRYQQDALCHVGNFLPKRESVPLPKMMRVGVANSKFMNHSA
jgi:hypothetical protein